MDTKVAVVILTYNHEKFIGQAVESILQQKTTFPVEILIFEDGSTDRTLEIANEWQQRFPENITVFSPATNQGIRKNVLRVFAELKSDYIAILDGDDFWSFPEKLQRQVDFLETHPEFNGAFHDAEIVQIDEAEKQLFTNKRFYSQNFAYNELQFPTDIISREVTMPSSSALLRKSAMKYIDKSLLTDNYSLLWKIVCMMVKYSRFYYFNEPWSVYRNHTGGISKRDDVAFHLSHINFLKKLLHDDFYKDYPYAVHKAISHEYQVILNENHALQKKYFKPYLWNEWKRLKNYHRHLLGKND